MYYQKEKWLTTTRRHNLHTIAKGTASLQRVEGKGHSIATVTWCSHGWPTNQCQHSSQEVLQNRASHDLLKITQELQQSKSRNYICLQFVLTFLQQDHKKLQNCYLPKHTYNAMQKKACSGLVSHCWGWCIRSLRISVKPLLLQGQLHSKWKAWSPVSTSALWHYHALWLPIWDFRGW